jgi:hypothetical protein
MTISPSELARCKIAPGIESIGHPNTFASNQDNVLVQRIVQWAMQALAGKNPFLAAQGYKGVAEVGVGVIFPTSHLKFLAKPISCN